MPRQNMPPPPTSAAASTPRHERQIVALHWLVALSIVALLGIGWYMVGVPRLTPARGFYYNLHKSLGIVAAALIVTLIARRLTHRAPPLPDSMPGWERKAARLGHVVLYLFMVLSIIAGYLTSSFSRFGPKFFGIPLPHWGWDDVVLREKFAAAHRVLALVFAVLIAVHVAAALKHLLVDRDGVFQRMLSRRSAAPPRRS
ncbi:MAG TPA: cytochrome b [Casimicrobiaceae bacterium]|nr:cytochrome b [Casimicrobiaceae bacterium]